MRCSNQCSEILAMHVRVVWTVLNNGLLFSSFLFWNMMNIFLPFLKNLPWIHDLKNLINHDPGREKNKNVFWSTSKCVRERHSRDNFSLPGNLSSYVHLKFTFQKGFELYFKLIRTAFYLLLWRIGFKDEHHVIVSIDWSREKSKEDLNWVQNLTPSLN